MFKIVTVVFRCISVQNFQTAEVAMISEHKKSKERDIGIQHTYNLEVATLRLEELSWHQSAYLRFS